MQAADSSAAPATPEISRTAESIHQEIAFGFAPARLYAALTDAQQFQKAVLLSAAVKSGMVSAEVPAKIVATPGGAFSLFAGHISGRFIELVPGQRIVQAWRAGDWAAGIFSIARFELSGAAGGTKLVFDHTGFPAGQADHLAAGWQANYWDPLSRLLSGS
jgi:activator of HSP90 ATPase